MIKVSVIGANGYTGTELLNLFKRHPEVKLVSLVSQSNSGVPVTSLYPGMIGYKDYNYDAVDYDYIIGNSDVVFTALPHGASAEAVARLIRGGVKAIDLSADFRYDDIKTYEETYKVIHPAKDLKGVYGLPELYRDKIKGAKLIGNPGCYTTCSILPLYPLVKEGLINPDEIIIDAASGTSGAGRKAELAYNFCEVNENFRAYSVGNHRHTSEIEEKISEAAGRKLKITFTPHLLPVQRGILSTIYTKPANGVTADKIKEVYEAYYGKEEFVRVDHKGEMPSLNMVKYSNYVRIGYYLDGRTGRLIVISALDNLIKGASGQAVQNMNIICGITENTGLTQEPYHL
jgi:N-acetyl-gamma-glutamyl-phosphate reductase